MSNSHNWPTHLAALPEEQRTAVEYKHLRGLPVTEVARLMGKSEAAVGGLLHRGLAGLRDLLARGSECRRRSRRSGRRSRAPILARADAAVRRAVHLPRRAELRCRVALEIRFFERVGAPAAGAVTVGMIDSFSTF